MKPTLLIFLLLSNCGLIVRGFFLENCYVSRHDRVFCNYHRLTQVPKGIPVSVKSIDLSKNNITKIQVSNFTSFPNLTTLDLKQNSISCIDRLTFSKLVSLKFLSLTSNKLVTLEDDVFAGLPTLLKLWIDSNQIQTVAPNAFRSLRNLMLLELSNNKLHTIAQVNLALQHMPKLRDLVIRNNGITTFMSQDLTNASTEITSLDVSKNPLVRFEVTADVFPKLKILNIGKPIVRSNLQWAVQSSSLLRQVTTLDISRVQLGSSKEWRNLFSSFSSLNVLMLNSMQNTAVLINTSCSFPKLSILQIQESSLNSIRSHLFQLCNNITTIDLKGNRIQQIENGAFEFLHYLRTLILSDNKLHSVPPATTNLASLQTLDLSFNHIKALGCQDFTGLTNLAELNLQGNNIDELRNCSFVGLSKLIILKLHRNSISELGNAFESSLPNLKVLNLNQNKLTAISKGEFSGLRSLTNLSLDQNQIKTLGKGSFSGLTSLLDLQLQQNELRRDALETACFNDLVNLRKLNLEKNYITYGHSSPLQEPPFRNLSSLEILVFSLQHSAGKSYFPSNFLQGVTNLSILTCANLDTIIIPDDFFTHTPRLNNLDIGNSYLYELSPLLFAPIPELTRLRVTQTSLRSMDFLINSNLTKLKFLEIRQNTISVISEEIVRSVPSLLVLDVKSNSFLCDCDNSWFVTWITNNSQTQVMDANTFRCNYPPQRRDEKLLDLNVQSCLVDIGFICFISSTCVNVVILVASFTFNFSRFHLTYAYYLFLAWLYDSRNRQKRAACGYDAFVSYNAHDEAWVYRELVPQLEQEQGWRLCLHHRDFIPGTSILENIVDGIYGSRKTICVISRRYLQSEWCSKEMQLASFRLFDEREDVLILLFLEDIPSSHLSPYYRMKRLLKSRSYLSWPRAAQHPQLFWEKLRQALRSTNTEEEDRLRLTVTH